MSFSIYNLAIISKQKHSANMVDYNGQSFRELSILSFVQLKNAFI
jgi:hypothetical protein